VPRAVLEITADTSGIAAAFGAIRTMAQQTEREVKGSMQRAATGSANAYRTSARQQATDGDQAAARGVAAANRSVQAFIRAEDQKRRAARLTAQTQQRVEQEATAHARGEASKRGLTAEQESRVKQTAAERLTRVYETEEKRQTAIAQREVAARNRNRGSVAHDIRRGLTIGRDAAINVARNAHSQIQDARGQRAESEHTLNAAFYQAGIGGDQATAMRAQIQTAITTGPLRGLSMESLSQGIMGAQTQFSVLSGATPEARQENLNRQLELASFARSTFQDPAEVMRVGGMLSQQGIRGADQMPILQSLTGMAQAGSIELSTLTSTALGPLMANIARTTNANQTPAQRAAAVRGAVGETMAVGEIGAAGGMTSRDSLNALAKMRGSVENPMMAERLDTRLRAANRADLADQLVTRDPAGHASLRNRSAVGLMSSLVSGMGGDANAVANLLSAGGQNAAMVLDAQQRRLIVGMASQTEGGGTIAQRVAGMQAQGARFGEADIARGRDIVDAEQRTALQSSEESRLTALSDNTSSINQLSNSFSAFVARNPLGTTLAATAVPLLGQMAAGFIGRQLAGTALGTALGVAAPAGGAAAGGAAAGGGALAAGGAIGATVIAPLAAAAAITLATRPLDASNARAALRADGTGGSDADMIRRFRATHAAPPPPTAEQIGTALVAALRAAPVVATVSPVDATHARTQAATP
jgi:hypothetical protein